MEIDSLLEVQLNEGCSPSDVPQCFLTLSASKGSENTTRMGVGDSLETCESEHKSRDVRYLWDLAQKLKEPPACCWLPQ